MNIYDFDDTIYKGDSTRDFYFFCLKKSPSLCRYMPKQTVGFLKYYLNLQDKTAAKQDFYSFLQGLKNREQAVIDFWNFHEKNIKPWYFERQREDDLIISASPEFLLKEIMKRLNIKHLICSEVDINTGKCISPNCHGQEKVRRFYMEYDKDSTVDEFYSDSKSDEPMAKLASRSFMVSDDKIEDWKF